MNKQFLFILITLVLGAGYFFLVPRQDSGHPNAVVAEALAAQFEHLSQNGNSSCSGGFKDSIAAMPDDARLQGSCCSPMSVHRYSEQIEGLQKFKSALRQAQGGEQSRTIANQNIGKIPDDPYDIQAGLAKELMSYYDMRLTPEEQEAYDYAMENSSEKGPCCCKCWRWYMYGGLGKYLIKNHGLTGEQLTELWDLSDGCGGDSEHHH